MARTRILHPQLFTDAELADTEHGTGLPLRLAYAALWCQADREGRFPWKPRELKVGCLPYDDVDFDAVLEALVSLGKIVRYEVDGREYGTIPNFGAFQRPHPREAQSVIPAMPAKDMPRTCLGHAKDMPRQTRDEGLPVVSVSVSKSVSGSDSVSVSKSVADAAAAAATGLSPELTAALQPFLATARYPASITGEIQAALDGMRGTVWPEATVIQALTDMQAANIAPFNARAFRAFLAGTSREAVREQERRADESARQSRAEGERHKRAAPPRVLTGLPPDQVPDMRALLAREAPALVPDADRGAA